MNILSIAAFIAFMTGVASADPPPASGGANQTSGVSGTFGQALFNGEVRLTTSELRDATASDDLTAVDGKKWLVLVASASNGTSAALDMLPFNASVTDARGDAFQAQPDKVKPMGGVFGVPPGCRWKVEIDFAVPAAFVPAQVAISPYDGKHPGFSIAIPVAAASALVCPQGFVWREASPSDHVCVTPAQRSTAARQNASAAGRVSATDRTYGPATCVQGFVWREAYPGDVGCVTPSERNDAANENANAPPQISKTP